MTDLQIHNRQYLMSVMLEFRKTTGHDATGLGEPFLSYVVKGIDLPVFPAREMNDQSTIRLAMVLDRFVELGTMFDALVQCQFYLTSYELPFAHVSPADHISNIMEIFLNRVGQIKDRLKWLYKSSNELQSDMFDVAGLINVYSEAFVADDTARNSLHHTDPSQKKIGLFPARRKGRYIDHEIMKMIYYYGIYMDGDQSALPMLKEIHQAYISNMLLIFQNRIFVINDFVEGSARSLLEKCEALQIYRNMVKSSI